MEAPTTKLVVQSQQSQTLSASYRSPNNPSFTHTHHIPTPPTDKVSDRTSYLSSLRKATAKLQEDINKELTSRMEEDKALEASTNGSLKTETVVDEAKEEDNYGEEVAEEED